MGASVSGRHLIPPHRRLKGACMRLVWRFIPQVCTVLLPSTTLTLGLGRQKEVSTLVHMLMCKNRAPLGLDRPWLAEGEPPRILDSCAHFKSVARCELASQAGLEDRGALCCNLDAM